MVDLNKKDSVRKNLESTVSVLISTHNRGRYIVETLNSLLAQTRPIDEIIVVDDASTDDTAETLAAYRQKVQVFHLEKNQGKSAALNMMIPRCRGDYIWLFDDDDVALPETLENHLAGLAARDDIDFTYSSTYHTRDADNIWNRRVWRLNDVPAVEPEAFLLQVMLGMNTPLLGMLIPRDVLIDIGLFDPELRRCEDLDLLLRLAAGYRGIKIDQPSFVCREHDGERGGGQSRYAARDRARVEDRYRKKVFRKIRGQFNLSYYTKHLEKTTVLNSEAARSPAALLQRGCIFLRQGLVIEALADIENAFDDPAIADVDPDWIRNNLTSALDTEPWMLDKPRVIISELAAILGRHNALGYARGSIRGLYWSLRREFELNRKKQAVFAGVLLAGFTVNCVGQRLRNAIGSK